MIEPLHLVDDNRFVADACGTDRREYLLQVLGYFQRLPQLQREALYLRTVEGLSIAEIAKITDTTENSVKVSLSVARNRSTPI